jgi:hypothetical protein
VGSKGWLLSLAAAAAIALSVALIVSTSGSDDPAPGTGLVAGQIYSTDRGDPIDLLYEPGEAGTGCATNLSGGLLYSGTRTGCFGLKEVDEGGTYQLVLPSVVEEPAIVVGVMPVGATGARVRGVGRKPARAETRGRWFLALLEPADPSVQDLETLSVRFDY